MSMAGPSPQKLMTHQSPNVTFVGGSMRESSERRRKRRMKKKSFKEEDPNYRFF